MSIRGLVVTLLATGLAEAVAKDEAEAKDETIQDRGFDMSAGLFGAHVSAWLRTVAQACGAASENDSIGVLDARHTPIPMILYCPACGTKHIDAAKPCTVHESCASSGLCYAAVHGKREMCDAWPNRAHRSHQCQSCKFEWRPADVATTGVEAINTRGAKDGIRYLTGFAARGPEWAHQLRADNERMRDLLDRRPAMNAGLVSSYSSWSSLVYASDAAFAHSHIPPKVEPLQ